LNWRTEALRLIKESCDKNSLSVNVFVPLPESGSVISYDHQIDWEEDFITRADVKLFWIPRDMEILLGLTTNFEFGEFYRDHNTIYGRPDTAAKIAYLDHKFKKHRPEEKIYTTLEGLVNRAMETVAHLQQR
jgi:hypothetical protein